MTANTPILPPAQCTSKAVIWDCLAEPGHIHKLALNILSQSSQQHFTCPKIYDFYCLIINLVFLIKIYNNKKYIYIVI